jgi:formylglycine-generating enzyme required for sulfatase activity
MSETTQKHSGPGHKIGGDNVGEDKIGRDKNTYNIIIPRKNDQEEDTTIVGIKRSPIVAIPAFWWNKWWRKEADVHESLIFGEIGIPDASQAEQKLLSYQPMLMIDRLSDYNLRRTKNKKAEVSKELSHFWLNVAMKSQYKILILSAELGMGKTRSFQYIFVKAYQSLSNPLAFVYAKADIPYQLKKIREQLKGKVNKAILFIDGLDEESDAKLLNETDKERLNRIIKATEDFHKVCISWRGRTELKRKDVLTVGIKKLGAEEAKRLASGMFTGNHVLELMKGQEGQLYDRPLSIQILGSILGETKESPIKYSFIHQLIKGLIEGLVEAEMDKKPELLARVEYDKRKEARLATLQKNAVRQFLEGEALSNEYNFIHNSLHEYLLAEALWNGIITEGELWQFTGDAYLNFSAIRPNLMHGIEPKPPQGKLKTVIAYYQEILAHRLLDVESSINLLEPNVLNTGKIPCWNLLANIPDLYTRALLLKYSNHFESLITLCYWYEVIEILDRHVLEEEKKNDVFDAYRRFTEIKSGKAIPEHISPYLQHFLIEWVIEELFFEENKMPYQRYIAHDGQSLNSIMAQLNTNNWYLNSEFASCTELDLSGLGLTDTDWLAYVPNINDLDISNNDFVDIKNIEKALWMPILSKLILDENPITTQPMLKELCALPEFETKFHVLRSIAGMVLVEGTGLGTFDMGQDSIDEIESNGRMLGVMDERPKHKIQLTDFYMNKYPLTVREFAMFVHANQYKSTAEEDGYSYVAGYERKGNKQRLTHNKKEGINWRHDAKGDIQINNFAPVVHISWYDAVAYCQWLSQETGESYRLPTEAEWEYTAKGGVHWQDGFEYAGSDDLNEIAWYFKNSLEKIGGEWTGEFYTPKPVGQKNPNQLGIYDMSGNVWEWCQDYYDEKYYKDSPKKNPVNIIKRNYNVLRGGSWFSYSQNCRVANRGNDYPNDRNDNNGFRLVRSPRT